MKIWTAYNRAYLISCLQHSSQITLREALATLRKLSKIIT